MPSYKKFAVFALATSTVYPALAAPIRYEKLRFGSRGSSIKADATMITDHSNPPEHPQPPEGTTAPADPPKASSFKKVIVPAVLVGAATAAFYNWFAKGSSGPSAPSPGSGSGSAVLASAVPPTVLPPAVPYAVPPSTVLPSADPYAVPPSTVLPSADPYAVPPSTVLPSANPSSANPSSANPSSANPSSVVPPSTVSPSTVPSPAASPGMKRTTETSESQPITEMEGRALGDYKLDRRVAESSLASLAGVGVGRMVRKDLTAEEIMLSHREFAAANVLDALSRYFTRAIDELD